MLAWYASNPDHGGNPDLSANPPPASSPHFRPTMQSPGPPYQSTMGSAMNYSERPYENHMASHCQSGSYPSYQPPSPYRPHPVSPPAHAHQYGTHGGHQMHGGLGAYGSGHQLGPYGSAPSSHYASLGPPDLYGGRPPSMYGGGGAMQQMKAAWGGESNSGSSADLMQYSQPSPRPMMPPPPTMHSPPHAGIGGGAPHYRQVPIVSAAAAGHSPHSWSQSQIPSPGTGVLHSPRTTPSPLPAHTRSPAAGAQPFSPPPAAPSPQQPQHHPPPSMTPHPPPSHKTTPSPPSGATTPAPNGGATRQTVCESPSGAQGPANSDPLQSLQKMVMLDSETVESPITRANYEMAANQAAAGGTPSAPGTGRPASYFSVEQLAGNEPGSPYPTYYNLDQNRLCTPPRTNLSTPTSSTFSSAPDSASSNSPRSDSRTTTASADSSNHVAHVNGDVNHHGVNPIAGPIPTDTPQPPPPPPPPPRRPDFGNFGVAGMRMTNGNHQPDATGLRDELGGPVSSDSENKDTQDFLQHLGGPVAPLPEPDGTVDLRRKSPKSPRGRRRVFGHDLQCDPLMDGAMDISRSKPMMMPPDERRNSTLPEFEITNGKPECDNVYPTDGGYAPRPPRYYSPTNRWNKMGPLEDGFMGMQQSKPYPDEYLPMPKPSKRGRKKKMFDQDGIVSEWDMYNSEIVHRPPRVSRGGSRGRRGSRRRGAITSYPANNGDHVPMDMYSQDPMMSMRNPSNGMGDMVGSNADKDLPWGSQNYHMGPPSSGMGTDYSSKDNMSVIKPPMIDSHSMDNSSMNNSLAQSQPPPNYQSDVPSDDRGRGPLLFTVNKDGSTVKLQDGQTNSNSVQQQQSQYYDPVLGQMVHQPMKKKRGRPFGSKNKPKPPGEERQPRRRRKKEVFFGPEGPPPTSLIKRRIINGPYVHIVGVRNKPLVVSVVNAHPKDENSESKYWPQKPQHQHLQFGGVIRQNMGMGTSPGLPHIYDTITKDRSWLCSLCCKNSHYRGLGDLFGPYYLNGEQKPSNYSSPPSPAPMSTFGNESSEPGDDFEPDDSQECPQDPTSCSEVSGIRRYPGKRKSDVMEQMFRAALLRKAKQANGQKPLEEMSNHMPSMDMAHSNPNQYPMDTPSADNKEFWVHEECAVWSKNVYLFGHRLRGLEETVLQSVDKLCSRCKFPGASLSCACENCPELYHYLCARDNWCYMDEDTYTIYCPQHKVKPFIIRVGEDQIEELELNAKRNQPPDLITTATRPKATPQPSYPKTQKT